MLYQQLDGSEKFIIHEVDGYLWVGNTSDVIDESGCTYRIIEDRYPLNRERLEQVMQELKYFIKEQEQKF